MTTPWLLLLLICTEPFPPECSRPTIDEITSNPMCIAVSRSCTLYQKWVDMADRLRLFSGRIPSASTSRRRPRAGAGGEAVTAIDDVSAERKSQSSLSGR